MYQKKLGLTKNKKKKAMKTKFIILTLSLVLAVTPHPIYADEQHNVQVNVVVNGVHQPQPVQANRESAEEVKPAEAAPAQPEEPAEASFTTTNQQTCARHVRCLLNNLAKIDTTACPSCPKDIRGKTKAALDILTNQPLDDTNKNHVITTVCTNYKPAVKEEMPKEEPAAAKELDMSKICTEHKAKFDSTKADECYYDDEINVTDSSSESFTAFLRGLWDNYECPSDRGYARYCIATIDSQEVFIKFTNVACSNEGNTIQYVDGDGKCGDTEVEAEAPDEPEVSQDNTQETVLNPEPASEINNSNQSNEQLEKEFEADVNKIVKAYTTKINSLYKDAITNDEKCKTYCGGDYKDFKLNETCICN